MDTVRSDANGNMQYEIKPSYTGIYSNGYGTTHGLGVKTEKREPYCDVRGIHHHDISSNANIDPEVVDSKPVLSRIESSQHQQQIITSDRYDHSTRIKQELSGEAPGSRVASTSTFISLPNDMHRLHNMNVGNSYGDQTPQQILYSASCNTTQYQPLQTENFNQHMTDTQSYVNGMHAIQYSLGRTPTQQYHAYNHQNLHEYEPILSQQNYAREGVLQV